LRDEELLASMAQKSHRHKDGSLHILDGEAVHETHDVNRHDDSIRAFSFSTDKAIPAESFALFQELLRSAHGPKLLRVKAIVKIAERPENPVIIHGVQHVFHKPIILEKWPDDTKQTRFVFITKDLEPDFVLKLWEAFLRA
jgi:G3E family GTPase